MDEEHNNRLQRALNRMAKPNVFDEIIKQVTPTEIPVRFIEYVTVKYNDGSIVELRGTDISQPVPVNHLMSQDEKLKTRAKMADVRVFLNTVVLGEEIDRSIDNLFKDLNIL